MIKLPNINPEKVTDEIAAFILKQVKDNDKTGCVVGLSGGVDSTVSAAIAKKAFLDKKLELVGYILPSDINKKEDTEDGIKVAKKLGIRYEVIDITKHIKAFKTTNKEVFSNNYDKGNMLSRIRANILSTKAASENKLVLGTGNKDEDFGIGYYTLFGDGAVHLSPIANLSKRLVKQMAIYLGFDEAAKRIPTAALEHGQTDFKDLGYSYEAVELVIVGLNSLTIDEIKKEPEVIKVIKKDIADYKEEFETKFNSVSEVVDDILKRHELAKSKMEIIHPPAAEISLEY